MISAYLAGPDVFRADYDQWADEARMLFARHGMLALLPSDSVAVAAPEICLANMALIDQADVVIANINPFRGDEPDSGTAFEIGYAVAKGKRVIAYLEDSRPLAVRLPDVRPAPGGLRDRDGWLVEDFGYPVNLMIAVTSPVVRGGLGEALRFYLDLREPLEQPASQCGYPEKVVGGEITGHEQ